MISLRCKMMVEEELKKLGIAYATLELGMVELIDDIPDSLRQALKTNLLRSGLEVMDDRKSILIEKIKMVVIEMIHYSEDAPILNFSDYVSEKLNYDYTYLSNMFSEVQGITIQQYIILHKIEKVKELLLYDHLSYKLFF
jgi:AraC-like DNA-binding protein